MLNAASIAARKSRARKTEVVTLPGSSEQVRLRVLDLLERDDYNLAMLGDDGRVAPEKLRGNKARLIAKCAIDEAGNPIGDAQAIIDAFDVPEIDFLHAACERINNIGRAATAEAAGNS